MVLKSEVEDPAGVSRLRLHRKAAGLTALVDMK